MRSVSGSGSGVVGVVHDQPDSTANWCVGQLSRQLLLKVVMRRGSVRITEKQAERLGGCFLKLENQLPRWSAGLDGSDRQCLIAVVSNQEAELAHILFLIESNNQRFVPIADATRQLSGSNQANVLGIVACLDLKWTRERCFVNVKHEPVARNQGAQINVPGRSGRSLIAQQLV